MEPWREIKITSCLLIVITHPKSIIKNVSEEIVQFFLRIEVILIKLVFDSRSRNFGKLLHLYEKFIRLDFNGGKVLTTHAGSGHAA
jgi:hypothetical protein